MLRTGAQQAGLALGVSHGGFTGMVRATAEALGAICEFDLSELWAIVPPRDFGLNSSAPSAPRNATGAALRVRIPPMHAYA